MRQAVRQKGDFVRNDADANFFEMSVDGIVDESVGSRLASEI